MLFLVLWPVYAYLVFLQTSLVSSTLLEEFQLDSSSLCKVFEFKLGRVTIMLTHVHCLLNVLVFAALNISEVAP